MAVRRSLEGPQIILKKPTPGSDFHTEYARTPPSGIALGRTLLPRPVRFALRGRRRRQPRQAQCLGMMNFTELASVPSGHPVPDADQVRLAVAAASYSPPASPVSELWSFLAIPVQGLLPRPHRIRIALLPVLVCRAPPGPASYTAPAPEAVHRLMQKVRQFRPSTVSRRFSVVAGFYRPCVIDGVLELSWSTHQASTSTSAFQPL
jgi:hypothetical protein